MSNPPRSAPKPIRLLLRAETKPFERRTPLTPTGAHDLIQTGRFTVFVESSSDRIFPDEAYSSVGCEILPKLCWLTDETSDRTSSTSSSSMFWDVIVGLKELPEPGDLISIGEEDEDIFTVPPLVPPHTHLFFAHCYKGQEGSVEFLKRFHQSGAELLDYEFLSEPIVGESESGRRRRICGMSKSAGFVGCGLSLLAFVGALNETGGTVTGTEDDRIDLVAKSREDVLSKIQFVELIKDRISGSGSGSGVNFDSFRLCILGYKGKCGTGCLHLCEMVGIPQKCLMLWDMEETARGGPFEELAANCDVLVNCIYLSKKIQPFLTEEVVAHARETESLRLKIFVDISCDVSSENNPFPINTECTTFRNPIRMLAGGSIKCIAVDHLPSLLPEESSTQFSDGLMTVLPDLPFPRDVPCDPENHNADKIWRPLRELFVSKVASALLEED